MTKETFDTTNQELKVTRLAICDLQEEAEQITTGPLRDIDREIAEWDATQASDIARATNGETGKATFSNAEARAAELVLRQTASVDRRLYQDTQTDLQAQIAAIRSKIARLQIEASFLRADREYAITHAPDELNRQLAEITDHIGTACALEALRAVRLVMGSMFHTADDLETAAAHTGKRED